MTTTTPFFPPKVISFVASKDDGELTVVTNPTVFRPLIPDQHGEIYLNGTRDLASQPLKQETKEEHRATATATIQPQHQHEPPEQTMARDDTCPPLQIITTAQTQTHPMQQQPLNPVSPVNHPREQPSWQPQQPQQHHQRTQEPLPSMTTTAIVPVSPSPPRNVNNNNDTDNRSTTENTAITVTSVSTTTGARLRNGGNVDLDYDGAHKPYPREIGRLKRRRKRVTATVGIVGGLVGLVTLGPLGGVAFGAGGAAATRVVAKRREKKKRQALADREIAQQLAGAPEVLCHKGIMA